MERAKSWKASSWRKTSTYWRWVMDIPHARGIFERICPIKIKITSWVGQYLRRYPIRVRRWFCIWRRWRRWIRATSWLWRRRLIWCWVFLLRRRMKVFIYQHSLFTFCNIYALKNEFQLKIDYIFQEWTIIFKLFIINHKFQIRFLKIFLRFNISET